MNGHICSQSQVNSAYWPPRAKAVTVFSVSVSFAQKEHSLCSSNARTIHEASRLQSAARSPETDTAISACTALTVEQNEMIRVMLDEPAFIHSLVG